MVTHWIRIGFADEVALASFDQLLPRGRRILVRTGRGVELASVLGAADSPSGDGPSPKGIPIIRPTTPDDETLLERLHRYKVRAVQRCQERLREIGSRTMLLDVDQLIDGGTLILHFLGDVDAIGQDITDEVVRQYEAQVGSIQLSELMTTGCGEGCGTEAAPGCSGSCAGCAIAGACAS